MPPLEGFLEAPVPAVPETVEVAPELRELDPTDTHLVIRGVSAAEGPDCQIWEGPAQGCCVFNNRQTTNNKEPRNSN